MRFTSPFVVLAVLAVAACGGTYTNPTTGATQAWSFDPNASIDKKTEAFRILEREKEANETVLRIHEQSHVPDPRTMKLCRANLEEIKVAKDKLRAQGIGG
jgi:hypothetical protein